LFSFPRPEDRAIAGRLIKNGADAVVGHHPHVVRGVELIDGKPIFYSLGNYFFSDIPAPSEGGVPKRQVARNREALVVELVFQRGSPLRWRLHAYWQEADGTYPDPHNRAMKRVARVSRPLSSSDYAAWYERTRRRFDYWGYRWHFRLPTIGYRGASAWVLRLARQRFEVS
jgi:hypothetical protein